LEQKAISCFRLSPTGKSGRAAS